MENVELAQAFERMAALLELAEANPFRVRAYRNAARTIEAQGVPLRKLVAEDADLTELPGIGKEMARHIRELVATGELGELGELAAEVPPSLIAVMEVPGVGPKKARRLWRELGLTTVDELEEAARDDRVAGLDGFGARSQAKILAGIEKLRQLGGRFKLYEAEQLVEPLLDHLRTSPGLERLEVAGSYRRRRETVGDVDLLVIAAEGEPVMQRFLDYPRVAKVLMSGATRGSVELSNGLQVDLRIVAERSYGAALVYFTGSKEHNIRLRQRAIDRGLRISEYGVFRAAGDGDAAAEADPWSGEMVAGADEEEVYASVELPWIAPELREDRGEITAAEAGGLPRLIEGADLRGDLQMHSTWSDGKASIEEMLAACAARGYEYFALTDHSKALAMTGGLDAAKLRRQWEEIAGIVARHPEIRLLRSMEVDILADGRLDLEDEMLAELDLVVVSVHSRFDLPAAAQTERILRAIRHPSVDVLAHPTGRLINRREPIAFDLDEVLSAARERGIAVELNAHPDRLDLKDTHLMAARRLGVPVVISTDAHRPQDLDLVRFGIDQARRAWLAPEDVLNTRSLDELLAWKRSRSAGGAQS